MNLQEQIKCDVLVIGCGYAGMAAAARASALGLKTVQVGSSSSLFLSSGLIDLLGVYPVSKARVIQDSKPALTKLRADIPDHPYSKMNHGNIYECLTFINNLINETGLIYQTKNRMNSFVLTSVGTFKPSFMIPKTFSNGSAKKLKDKRVLFVDFKGLKGYSAKQVSNVVHTICSQSSSLTIEIPDHSGDLTPIALASLFENDCFIKLITKNIQSKINDIDIVGFPAVCGIHNSSMIVDQLEKLIGCPCFEIPGLPPSIPGLRLKNAFEKIISQNDVTVLNKAKIKFDSFNSTSFFMTADNQNMSTAIEAKGVILATGRFHGEGLNAERGSIHETIFNLPVYQPEQRNQWYDLNFFNPDGHTINQTGIETNEMFQPLDEKGAPIYEHLYAAGSILAYNDWIRLKSGAGVSFVSAITAVNHFYDTHKRVQ